VKMVIWLSSLSHGPDPSTHIIYIDSNTDEKIRKFINKHKYGVYSHTQGMFSLQPHF